MAHHFRNISILCLIAAAGAGYWATRPDMAQVPIKQLTGPDVNLKSVETRVQKIPTVNIADVKRWSKDGKPNAAAGLKVESFAEGLDHPRNMYVLPNGDILVAEANKQEGKGGGLTNWVAGWLMDKAGAGVPSADRITLLRDADDDGKAELKTVFLSGLTSPFGMALVDGRLFIANTTGIVAVPYKDGDTKITEKPANILNLNAKAPNMHWTKNLIASADGKTLYISVGSNSNIGEGGMDIERGRAMIIEFDLQTRKAAPWGVGLRNPVGLDFDDNGQLWTVVNERDMLGSDMVPDYLTMVPEGSDFGWPWHYWGGYTDERVEDIRPELRQYERRPDYGLGPHTAPLGLAFSRGAKLGDTYGSGAFIARHGSWNRVPASGYDVIFVRFQNGQPVEQPLPVLNGFLDKDGNAQGRPTMLAVDKTGGLLVSDDVGNRIWRVTAG
ncbi:MAG: sorbosone dehydrogenase family protein [Sphingomonadales bacterium]|nr:sorbosone dehydrogenase family protein [Sphingomonadales bacterium]